MIKFRISNNNFSGVFAFGSHQEFRDFLEATNAQNSLIERIDDHVVVDDVIDFIQS